MTAPFPQGEDGSDGKPLSYSTSTSLPRCEPRLPRREIAILLVLESRLGISSRSGLAGKDTSYLSDRHGRPSVQAAC